MSTCSNTTFPWKNKDAGFDNIKKGREGIRKHADSAIHRSSESVLNTSRNLSAHRILADKSVKEEFSANKSGLKAIFENVRFCVQQGIALRGHRNEEYTANFHCLMNLIGKFDPKVFKYLSSAEKYKFLSKDIQNEMLLCISHSVLRDFIDRVRKESIGKTKQPFYSITVDETSEINRCEQVSFCVRFCNNKMESEEVFLGFYQTGRTDSETLLNLVKSSLLSLGLSFYGVRGQAYDGASNMAARHNGLQAKILAENRKALYLYCFGHQLNLLQNLETFQMYFCLRVVQKLLQVVHPIHKMCQGRKATAGDIKLWVNSLSLSLFAEGNNPANANALYDAVKIVTLETLNLPALPRAKRAGGARGNPSAGDPVTEEHIKKFSEGIYTSVMNSGVRALTERYSRQDLE